MSKSIKIYNTLYDRVTRCVADTNRPCGPAVSLRASFTSAFCSAAPAR
jgi:hypothetical protein